MTIHFVNLLDELRRRSLRMASLVEDMVHEACDAVTEYNIALARRVVDRDADVDAEEVRVEAEIIRLLALYQPVGSDLRFLCTALKVNDDLERIADCAVNIAERACHIDRTYAMHTIELLTQMGAGVRRMLRKAVEAYANHNDAIARQILVDDEAVDALYVKVIQHTILEAPTHPEGIATHLDMLSAGKNLERIADHATNIAEDVIYMATGKIVRHQRAEASDFDSTS